jgi:hypothetical protein
MLNDDNMQKEAALFIKYTPPHPRCVRQGSCTEDGRGLVLADPVMAALCQLMW